MRALPATMIRLLAPFAPLFSERVFEHVQLLLVGAILAPGKRTVASALRAVGLEEERRFCRYHRVLSRAVWSSRAASCGLLRLLVWRRSSRMALWFWASTRRWSDAEGRRFGPEESTATLGSFEPRPLRQGERFALGVRDATGSGAVGLSGLGFAVPFCSSLLRALRQGAWQSMAGTTRR
jgi:hypothetical protein